MAQALNITVESTFDSTLPVSLHPLGVPGYANRYVVDTLAEAAGAQVSILPDKVGLVNIVNDGVEAKPVVGSLAGFKYLSFDGTSMGMRGNFTVGTIKTMAAVVRVTAATLTNMNFMFGGGVNFTRGNDNSGTMFLSGLTTQPKTAAGTFLSNKFVIVIYVIDGLNSYIQVNSSLQTVNPAGTPTGTWYKYGLGKEGASYGKADFAELIGWPQALTAPERATVLASLQARYAALLAA